MFNNSIFKKLLFLLFIPVVCNFAQATTRYVSPGGSNTSPYTSWATAATSIQTAVDFASSGDLILVDDGLYTLTSNISITKAITLRSQNGKTSAIINGNNVTRCVYINNTNAVVDGFTISNGYNPGGFGGGVDIASGGTLQNCNIINSQARDGGGVAIDNNGLVQNCSVFGNRADNNSGSGYGGGVRLLSGGTIRNCLVYGNSSVALGGGINIWDAGTIQNCTIVNNNAPNGGGVRCRGNSVMQNSISYFNGTTNWVTDGSSYSFSNNCTTPALPSGTGNITSDPLFVNYTTGDFHLLSSSPCINTGINQAWMSAATDIDGNARIFNTTVDIGAYEYKVPVPTISTIPVPSWPVGNATIYSLQPTLFWYIGALGTGLTYEIQCVKLCDPWPADNVYYSASGLSYTFTTNLLPGTQYAWRVRARLDAENKSAWSTYASFTTVGFNGGPVVPIASWPVGNATIYTLQPLLNWYLNSPGIGLSYEIQCVKASDPWPADNVYYTSSDLNYSITVSLIPGQQYAWRVRSKLDDSHKSAWSDYALFTTYSLSAIPVTPSLLWPVNNFIVPVLTPTLTWYQSSTNINLTYELQCVKASDPWPADNVYITVNSLSYTFTSNLIEGTQYAWRVRSVVDASHKSAWSAYGLFSTSSSGISVITPSISWPVGNATIYTLKPSLIWYVNGISTGFTYEFQCVKASDPWPADNVYTLSSSTLYTLTSSLAGGTQYAWRVRSKIDDTHKSSWSAYALFTTAAINEPAAPVAASPSGGVSIENNSPMLSWYLPTSSNIKSYEVSYSNNPEMTGAKVVTNITDSKLELNGLSAGAYYWKVKSNSSDGQSSSYSGIGSFNIINSPLAVNTEAIPEVFELKQNYPNPFNPTTVINFSLPAASQISLKIFDILGREIKTLISDYKERGNYSIQWDGKDDNGNIVQSGTYFYRLISGDKASAVKKLIFIK